MIRCMTCSAAVSSRGYENLCRIRPPVTGMKRSSWSQPVRAASSAINSLSVVIMLWIPFGSWWLGLGLAFTHYRRGDQLIAEFRQPWVAVDERLSLRRMPFAGCGREFGGGEPGVFAHAENRQREALAGGGQVVVYGGTVAWPGAFSDLGDLGGAAGDRCGEVDDRGECAG